MTQLRTLITSVILVALTASGVLAQTKRYEPNWESLNARQCPKWFPEAKFGIFIHWGIYSVPAWGPKGTYTEWYWYWLRERKLWGAFKPYDQMAYPKFHAKNYGEDFEYQDFAAKFRAELFDPDEWADIFERSGAKYVVLTSKHHDGFCLWPSAEASKTWGRPYTSVETGARRDLCGDLAKAVRKRGLRMGYYYSLYEWYNPLYKTDLKRFVAEHMMPQFKDLVTRYEPAVVFADGEWEHPAETWRSTELLAWLYNQGPNPDEVVVNDRWGKDLRSFCGDYYTTEYGLYANKEMSGSHPWEESRGIGHSYGYNRTENVDDYMSRTKCVRTLIDMVSRGGNLLLDIGPTGDGRIPVIMQDRLLAIGRWLKTNSESIYGTTAGPFQDLAWGRSTAKGNKVYLHIYEWPAGGKLDVPPLENRVVSSYLLADPDRSTVPVSGGEGGGWQLDLSGRCPQKHATVVVLTLDGPPKVPKKTEAAAGEEDEQD